MNRSVLPFGPFHENLYENLNLTVELKNDIIVSAIPSFGYAYRGIERFLSGMNCSDALPVMEKICGNCGFSYSLAFCRAIEQSEGIIVPPRAIGMRIAASELELIHNRFYTMMWAFNSIGHEKAGDIAAHLRDKVMDLFELTAGKRFMSGFCVPGGVAADIDRDSLLHISLGAIELEEDLGMLEFYLKNDLLLVNRLKGVGNLSKETALKDCVVGLAARASGVETDSRIRDAAYADAGFMIKTEDDGGCLTRLKLSLLEIHNSIDIISHVIANLADGEIIAKMPDYPDFKQAETVAFAEQGGGELAIYLKLNAGGEISNIAFRSASAANMRTAIDLLIGAEFKDISVILSTMGICMPCFEK